MPEQQISIELGDDESDDEVFSGRANGRVAVLEQVSLIHIGSVSEQ
jgi:hypothetical protein